MLPEAHLDVRNWDIILPISQSCVNHSPVQILGKKCPMEIFTGLPSPPLLVSFIAHDGNSTIPFTVNTDSVAQQSKKLMIRLQQMGKVVESSKRGLQDAVPDASIGAAANFEVGDFVMRSRVDPQLRVRCVGPFVVTEIKENCFEGVI